MPANLSISNSKKQKPKTFLKWLGLICFAALIVAFAIFLGNLYEEKAGLNKINEWSRQRFEDFYALEENRLDLIFLDSSHSYCTFDPENFDAALDINSFQLAMPSQNPDMTYCTLLEVLNYQKPGVVVMELYWDLLSRDFEAKQVDTTFQFMRNDEIKNDFYKHGFPINERVKRSIKSIRYQQDFFAYANKRLADLIDEKFDLKRTVTQNDGEEYYRSKGYIYCDYVMSPAERENAAKSAETDGHDWNFSEVQKSYLERIVRLCEENGIKLIFVTAPISNVTFSKINNYDVIHEKLASFAAGYGLDYLDFNIINREEKLFDDSHFRDGRHLNDAGVKIADEYFIRACMKT